MKVTGRGHCGAITWAATIDPDKTRICHCTDCQRLSGTAFRVAVPVEEADFRLLSGAPTIYIKRSDTGAPRQQAFCGTCGTPIYAAADAPPPRRLGLRVGALDQRAQLVPKREFWCQSRVAWLDTPDGTERHDRQ